MLELYVDPTGRDDAPGTREQPLATPHGARDALRRRRRDGLPPDTPVTLWFAPGVYRFDQSLNFEAEDAGTSAAPVCWRAMPGAEVRWTGARSIDAADLVAVRDAAVLDRLSPAVRDRVVCLDLAAQGITDTGGRLPHGFGHPEASADLDLYDHDQPLFLARWPRNGYAVIGEVIDSGTKLNDPAHGALGPDGKDGQPRGATFVGDAERIRRWRKPSDLACFGMWSRDWAPSTIPVAATDPVRGTLTLATPSCYGVGTSKGRRYAVKNILEEIIEPGDWAIDRDAAILYLLPPPAPEDLVLTVSALTEPLVVMNQSHHIELRDLIIEGGRFHGVVITGDDHRIGGCTLRNLGGRGLHIQGRRNRVQGCHVYQTGQGGVAVSGGNRRTLEAAGNIVDNCEIHDFNRVCMTYNPAVQVGGCGQRVTYNHFYDAPHNAILLHGNDHVIEFNEIDHVAQETDDAAAFYMGRNPSEQGVVIRHNFFHHVGTPSAWGTSAIYPDDGASGLTIIGNVFYRCGHAGQVSMAAIFANGGKDHRIDNNIFVDCRLAVGLMLMTKTGWVEFLRGEGRHGYMRERLYEQVDIRSDTYLKRYPWLAEIEADPGVNTIRRNLLVNCGRLVAPEERQRLENNWMTATDPGFVDADRLDFTLKPDSETFRRIPGFDTIPFAEIGLRVDEIRPALPARKGIDCRLTVVEQPVVEAPGDSGQAVLQVQTVNLSARPVQGLIDLWSMAPQWIGYPDGRRLSVDLPANGVARSTVRLTMTARPDVAQQVGARICGEHFSLPIPLRPRYQVTLSRCRPSMTLDGLSDALAEVKPLWFLRGEAILGTFQCALCGDALAVHAVVRDQRIDPATPRWPTDQADWNGPLLGLLVAPIDAADTGAVCQLIFLPHGGDPGGTLWSFAGIEQRAPDAQVQWRATICESGGWQLTALIPGSALGITPDHTAFRFDAMANIKGVGDDKPSLATLFGSRTAQLELETLAAVSAV